ncbi:MAG: DNA alkylation response protein, partial [Alphaproteobacteria bacterium]
MAPLRPRTDLATHEVSNQPPPFEDVNLYEIDRPLQEAVRREGGKAHENLIRALGARCGSAEVMDWAEAAHRYPPELNAFDRFGRRIDEVRFHPAYHHLMDLGLGHQVASIAWTTKKGGHVAHTALEYLMAQAEPGVC